MAMTVPYSVVLRKNPAEKGKPARYYAQAQASGGLNFEELCEAITGYSTCTETDARTAISDIFYEVRCALKVERIVGLGDLGSLQIRLNSEGAISVEEFSGSMIRGVHLIFRPDKVLVELVKILSYRQVLTCAVAQAGVGDGGGEDPDKNPDSGGDGSDDGEAPDPTVQLAGGSR